MLLVIQLTAITNEVRHSQ